MLVSIYRYNPDTDEKPFMQDVQVQLPEDKDLMVLDVLALAKQQDPVLYYRRSCREGVCGSDGMNINGNNGLACITPLSSCVKNDKLVLRPLPALPVIRDLVIDMDQFYKQYEKVKPFLLNNTPAPGIERLQSPEDREKLDGSCTMHTLRMLLVQTVLHFGGIQISLLAQPACCRLIAFLRIPEIPGMWKG